MSNPNQNSTPLTRVMALVLVTAAIATVVLTFIVVPLARSLFADGAVTYCYVEQVSNWNGHALDTSKWALYGHREWRMDRDYGIFNSFNDAAAAAQALGCPSDIVRGK